MAKYKIFKLHFRTPLHIGLGRSAYDSSSSILHSDTISSALAAIKAQHGASSEEILSFMGSFVVSSAFPFMEEMYFLPRPFLANRIIIDDNDSADNRKLLKSVQYIELSVWKDFVNGSTPSIRSSQIHGEYVIPLDCEYFVTPLQKQEIVRLSVNRSNEKSGNPFYFEWSYFNSANDCGLYFIVEAGNNVMNELEMFLRELGETGIGTDKTVGGGQFDISTDCIELPTVESDAWLSLSLYLPSLEEQETICMEDSYYNISLRGGFIAGSTIYEFRHLWKKSVYMYEEGSVFSLKTRPDGVIIDLRPEWNAKEMHPVFRSGKALFIPVKTVKP